MMTFPLDRGREVSIQFKSIMSFPLYFRRIPFAFAFPSTLPFAFLYLYYSLFLYVYIYMCVYIYIFGNNSRLLSHFIVQKEAMKDSLGTSHSCPVLKSLSSILGGMLCCHCSPNKYKKLDAKLERKMMEVKKSASGNNSFRSINGIIMRFPQFKEGLKNIRGVFEHYDEDSNGTIDCDEFRSCLEKLQLHLTEKEIDDLFNSCDIDGSRGIQFNEFIVLLCLIYLLVDPLTSRHTTSKMGSPQLEATFDTIIEAFLFLDKNGNGKLNEKDMIKALNEGSPWEKSPARITRTRFKEMDWDKNGKVSFREFLFAFIDWVGIDTDDEIPVTGS